MIGFVVVALGLSMGINCGYPINPARDFAPRLFTAMIGAAGPPGYGKEVFTGKFQSNFRHFLIFTPSA